MIKTDKFYPCNHCAKQKKHNLCKCPFGKKSMCSTYQLCEAITYMENAYNNAADFEEEFIDVITDVLRIHGYVGEIRKTEFVNI